jgi:DNA polymerase-3 subunit beta
LNGVSVVAESDILRFVATDGRRLAMLARPLEREGSGQTTTLIVGTKGLLHFERVAAAAEEWVDLALTDRFMAVRTPHAEVTVRAMDGNFPAYDEIVPKDCPNEAKIKAGLLGGRLRQVQQFTSVESQSVVLAFKPGELGMAAAGGDGRADVHLGVDYDGPEEKIGFNPAYLLDALKVVDGEEVRFAFTSRNAAAKLTDEAGFLYVVMPVLID